MDVEMKSSTEVPPQDHVKGDDKHQIEEEEEEEEEERNPDQKKEDHPMPSPQQQVETLKKKYGGLLPKKPPLISKDHEHAFFDSADWALGKQGAQKAKGPPEALRPKLEPTPHHPARSWRATYAPPAHDQDVVAGSGACEEGDEEKKACASGGDEGQGCDRAVSPSKAA